MRATKRPPTHRPKEDAMSRAFAISILIGLFALVSTPADSQTLASESLRAEISEKLQALVDAANAGDAEAFFALSSGSPNLTIAGDGRIMRGLTDVRMNLKDMFVEHGRYKWEVSGAEVLVAGSNVAIAVAPCQFTAIGDSSAVQLTGAITVVFARDWFWQDYKVVHSHRSTGRIGVAVSE
jgi:ketosteroid isomerase-like protein